MASRIIYAGSRILPGVRAGMLAACIGIAFGDNGDSGAATSREPVVWVMSDTAHLEIGVVDGARPYQFHNIAAAFLLQDGRVVVADGGSWELRFFSPSGEHLGSFGRRGQGPGEFASITAVIKLPADTLLVHDLGNARLTAVTAEKTIAYQIPAADLPGARSSRLLGRLSPGTFAFATTAAPVAGMRPGYRRDTTSIVISRRNDLTLDTLLRLPSTERFHVMDGPYAPVRPTTYMYPFGYTSVSAVWNGRVVGGTGESRELLVADPVSRSTTMLRRPELGLIAVNSVMLDLYEERQAGGRSRQAIEGVRNLFGAARGIPAYSDFVVDDGGLLWVGGFVPRTLTDLEKPSDRRHWLVLDARGVAVARVATPGRFMPLHITQRFILGRVRDEDGVQSIRIHRLHRR